MITNNGKDIIAKYIVGEVPSFATHIAVGCGSKPLKNTDSIDFAGNQVKKVLDFEMVRAPIISQGFVDDNVSYNITNKTKSNNIAILTIGNHSLNIGDNITVKLNTPDSNFDGTYTVYDTSLLTISYYKSGSDISSSSTTGTLTATRTKIALTAALPSENRYEITEVGLWSAANNILATGTDSRLLCSFAESWQGHSTFVFTPPFKQTIGTTSSIDQTNNPEKMFYVSTSNTSLHTSDRRTRKEGPRFGNTCLMVRGDTSNITGTSNNWTASDISNTISSKSLTSNVATIKTVNLSSINVGDTIIVQNVDNVFNGTYTVTGINSALKSISYNRTNADIIESSATGTVSNSSTHIHLNNFNFAISQNSPSDELILAFSVIDKDSLDLGVPDKVKILMEFYKNEVATTASGFAKKEIEVLSTSLNNNRYQTIRFKISDLITDTSFNASDISVCRIFTSIIKNNQLSSDYYIAYDGFRLDNITTDNPVYKLSGYSVVQNVNGYPIIKLPNSNNYIEFRISLGII